MENKKRVNRENVKKCEDIIDLRTNNEGSTLMLVVAAILIVSITVVAFQTAVASFTTRTLTKHYEDQAYLSARSVAEAIVDKIEEDSASLRAGSTAELTTLLTDLYGLAEGESLELGAITFDGLATSGVDLDTGTVEAYIHRVDATTYVVEAVSNVNGDIDSVEIALSGEATEGTSSGGYIEGNWDGFYTDFMVGTDESFTLNAGDINLVLGLDANYDFGGTQYLGNIYANEDVILQNVKLENGSITSEGSIVINDNVSVSSNIFTAVDKITMNNSIVGTASMYSNELVINGDDVTLNGGPYVAETVTINGSNVTINGSGIICRDLIINGNNVTIISVTADNMEINGSNFNYNPTNSSTAFADTEYGETIADLENLTVIFRTLPDWADYDVYKDIVNVYDGVSEPYNWAGIQQLAAGNYYTIDNSTGNFNTNTTTEANGTCEVEWTEITVDDNNKSWSDLVYVVVKDGQNLEVTLNSANVYFILEGNAKVKFSSASTSYLQTRIYGQSASSATYDAIMSEAEGVSDMAALMEIVESYWDDISAVIVEGNNKTIAGSVVVPYMKLDGLSITLNETAYSDGVGNDYASDSDNLTGSASGGDSSSSYMTFEFGSYVN